MEATLHEGHVEALLPDWAEVFAADDRATPFQSPGLGARMVAPLG
jgi:hypothetical protein